MQPHKKIKTKSANVNKVFPYIILNINITYLK